MRLALALLMVLPATARAAEDILYADCGTAGCSCHLSSLPLTEIEAISGQPAPPGAAAMTLAHHQGQFYWTTTPPDALDLAFGGDGVCAIEVFPALVPQDGTWSGTIDVLDISGCLPQVAQMVPPIAERMTMTRKIAWNGVFDPARFGQDGTTFRWTRQTAESFVGSMPLPANGVLDIGVDATANLTAPDRAEATLTIRFEAAQVADAAALAMIGMSNCTATAAYEFRRTGP